jgi:DNA mismatch repair protein MutS
LEPSVIPLAEGPLPTGDPKGAPRSIGAVTPMMRQYLEVKERHRDAILFFRLGDFYEMFFEDAVTAAEILQITLTSRAKGDERVPMCGIPYHAAKGHIARLVERGLKVAICDQVEDAASATGIVRRDVTRVITPGMVLDEDLLDARTNNFLCSIVLDARGGGFALLDASTGEFFAGTVDTDEALADEIGRSGTREVILPARQSGDSRAAALLGASRTASIHPFPDEAFDPQRATAFLSSHFGTRGLAGFGFEGPSAGLAAAAAALRYLKETQRAIAAHVDRIALHLPSAAMVLDEHTRENLELHRTLRDGRRKGSLLGLLDRSATAMGGRRLARWLSYPLLDLAQINARLDAVSELAERAVLREELAALLRDVADIERLASRLSLAAGNARDLRALADSLLRLPEVATRLAGCEAALLRGLIPSLCALEDLAVLLDRAVAKEPPATLREGGLLEEGHDAELDRLVAVATKGKDFLLKLESDERERTRIASLKVRYNRVFGYYIEVTKANLHLVPSDYVRKQTTAQGERFVTSALKAFEEQVLDAEERRYALELALFEKLREKVVARVKELREAADAVATADAIHSLARAAAEYGYVRPTVDDSDVLEIEEGRHPVVERLLCGEPFVPNDIRLDRQTQQILIITGPNMAGKSTVMRQVALTALLAQMGSFVPARRARIGRCDRIFTRVGASDNLARGQSTFMVEMTETANILHNATSRSLIILDEIGRGTSTFDGLSIAWAVAEHLHDRVFARTLFATHYHELVDLSREKPRAKNATIAVKEWEGKVVFLRKLVAGGASRSYGIEVARLAGLPPEVLVRARQVLANLERAELDDLGHPQLSRNRRRDPPPSQLGLFAQKDATPPEFAEVVDALKGAALDSMTPLSALNFLAELKGRLK